MIDRIFAVYDKLEARKLVGDIGFGLIIGIGVCILLHVTEAVQGEIWGVPWFLVYGLGIALGVTFVSATWRLIPDLNTES